MLSHLLDLRLIQVRNREKVNSSITVLREVSNQILASVSSTRDKEVLRVSDEVQARHSDSSFEVSDRYSVLCLDREVEQE